MRTITQTLNMTPGGVPPVIHVSQYDSDFTITFTLFSLFGGFTIESGTTAQIRGTKSSGTGYSADAAINISAKTVTVTGNQQMTAAAGQNIFEIVLKKNNKEISSKNFILHVEHAALDADTITDESVLKELNAIIEGAETATQAAEDANDAADRAEAAAQSLVIDPTPTQGSAHAVSSGGVFDALQSAGLSEDAKQALLACFEHVAWVGGNGQSFYNALDTALNGGLPAAYTKVAYLESTGTQYIQTNIVSQIPLEMRAKFMPRNGDEAPMVGAIDRSDTNNSRFFLLGATGGHATISDIQVANRFGKDSFVDEVYGINVGWVLTHNPVSFSTPTTVISRVEYSGTSGKVNAYISDGTSDNTHELTTPTPLGAPILLFIKPTSMSGVSMRLYYIRFYIDAELIFNGIPCVRKSDNKPGLYDKVSDTFFTNAGTGEFVTG